MVWEDAALSKRHLLLSAVVVKDKVVSQYLGEKEALSLSLSLSLDLTIPSVKWMWQTNKFKRKFVHRKLKNGNCNNHLYTEREMATIEQHREPPHDSCETIDISMQTIVPHTVRRKTFHWFAQERNVLLFHARKRTHPKWYTVQTTASTLLYCTEFIRCCHWR